MLVSCGKQSQSPVSVDMHRNIRPLGLDLGLVLLLLALLGTLVLDVLVVDSHGLVDLGAESVVIVDPVAADVNTRSTDRRM